MRALSSVRRGDHLESDPGADALYDSAVKSAPVRGALGDVFRYRALVRLLVRRDLTVRYKRSILGVTWTILNPLLTTIIMWLVFNHLFHSKIPGVPYIVYMLAGNLIIIYFQQSVTMTSGSIAASAPMLTKVYIPPVIFAFAAATSGAINLLFGLVPLIIFQLSLGVGIPPTFLLIPVELVFLLAMIAGLGLFCASYAILFDDILNLINVLLILFMYLTPIFYPITIIPIQFRQYFYINPLVSYVNVFRFLAYGGQHPSWICLPIIVLTGTVGFMVGLAVFVRRWPALAALI